MQVETIQQSGLDMPLSVAVNDTPAKNKGGRPKGITKTTIGNGRLQQRINIEFWRELAAKSVLKVYQAHLLKCLDGDMDAIKEFYNRFYGKSTEHVDLTVGIKPIPILDYIIKPSTE